MATMKEMGMQYTQKQLPDHFKSQYSGGSSSSPRLINEDTVGFVLYYSIPKYTSIILFVVLHKPVKAVWLVHLLSVCN